jgi:hypothetical protein
MYELLDTNFLRDMLRRLQNLDVLLSTRASEATLSGIKAQTDKLVFDASSRLRVNAEVVANPPNLDVSLSSRASEATLAGLSGKFPSAVALADNLGNPTTTTVGAANLGWDGTYWRRLASDTAGRLRVSADVVANPPNLDVLLSSRASEATLSSLNTEVTNNTWQKMRYGRVLSSLVWVYGSVVSAPAAGTALASYSVPAGKQGFIYGYFITATEANQFEIRWTSSAAARAIRIVFVAGGSVHGASLIALNEGLPADAGTTISIVNISAGASGNVYQAGLLVGIP